MTNYKLRMTGLGSFKYKLRITKYGQDECFSRAPEIPKLMESILAQRALTVRKCPFRT